MKNSYFFFASNTAVIIQIDQTYLADMILIFFDLFHVFAFSTKLIAIEIENKKSICKNIQFQ